MKTPSPFGLTPRAIELIRSACQEFAEIESVIVFGSRAMGNYKPGSDVDLAVKGSSASTCVPRLSARLNEHLPLPYLFDVIDYHGITHPALRQHIDQYGQVLYQK